MIKVNFIVNNRAITLEIHPHTTLLEILSTKLSLFESKIGCGNGNCGVCSVLIDGEPVNSCQIRAIDLEGVVIETSEKIDNDYPEILKQFESFGGAQCGFCVSGFIVSAKAIIFSQKKFTEEEIRDRFSAHICQCSGNYPYIQATLFLMKNRDLLTKK
ncbi:2Fe-2S iron-sulfur cluster binding domain-containing protein [bacterium]|nr:2Fe-2S iron-sulfur cluster binding domain-containing protein [bacterium]